MTKVEELQASIAGLPPEEFARLREWVLARDWEQWDAEIATDAAAGRLDFLLEEAKQARAGGKLREF